MDYEDDADFVYKMRDQLIRRIIGIEKIETYLDEITPGEEDSCQKFSDFSEILGFIDNPLLIQKNKLYYEGWLNEWIQLLLNRNACRDKIVELTDDSDYIIRKCQSMSCEIMDMSILSHPKESEQYIRDNYIKYRTLDNLLWRPFNPDEIDQDSIEEVDEYTYSFKIPRLKNLKYHAFSPVSHNYVSIVEEYLAENRIEKWKDTCDNLRFRNDSFGDHILLMIYKIAEVYNYMTDYLSDNSVESKLLNYIIFTSPYKDIILNIVCNSSVKELQSTNTKDSLLKNEIDTNILCPIEIRNRKRLRNYTLINKVCVYLNGFFSNADTGDLLFVFFGIGKRPSKSLDLKTTKKDLCLFITFLLGNKNISRNTWIYFANYINYGETSVFPLDPNHKDWQSNPPSGFATADEKIEYKNTLIKVLTDYLKRGLTKEELEDLN